MAINLPGYYDHYESVDRPRYYEQHLFTAESPLQSRELNELQSASRDRLRRISDALFKDGNVLGGAEVIIGASATPGKVTARCTAGTVYLDGGVRLVPERSVTINATGKVVLGVYLTEAVITATDDADLRDPAVATFNNQEPGAARLQVVPQWGYEGEPALLGRFYAVYQVDEGAVLNNAAPPQVNAVEVAISRYDRQSTGGFYLTNGMKVALLAGATESSQTLAISEGTARVNGQEIVRQQARRFTWNPEPDAATVDNEQHAGPATRGTTVTITTRNAPVQSLFQVSAERIVTQAVTHPINQGTDLLAFGPVRAVLLVANLAANPTVTYTLGVDYTVVNGAINWSPGGAEPATGGTYYVTYRFTHTIYTASIQLPTSTGCQVLGDVTLATSNYEPSGSYHAYLAAAGEGGEILVSYTWALPRYDLLCLTELGEFATVKGVPSVNRPLPPATPSSLLRLATIEQRWSSATRVVNNAIRMVPMNELNALQQRVDNLFALMAEERLALNLTLADPSSKRGVFTDPCLDDDLREPSLAQTAAIFRGELTLGVAATPYNLSLPADVTLDSVTSDATVAVAQLAITDQMAINPYMSFSPMPGTALLSPAVDLWTDFETNWLPSVEARRFDETVWTNEATKDYWINQWQSGFGNQVTLEQWIAMHTVLVSDEMSLQSEVEKVGTRYVDLQYLREIPVTFHLQGFLNGEVLTGITLDDVVLFNEAVQ